MQLLYFSVATCFFAIPLLFFSFYRWYQTRKNKRAPFTDKFLRSPGQSLNEKIESVSEDVSVYSGCSMCVLMLTVNKTSHILHMSKRFLVDKLKNLFERYKDMMLYLIRQ